MKKAILTLALLLFILPLSADVHKVISSVRPLQAKDSTGELQIGCTATSINMAKQYWLTAAHCLGGPRYIEGESVVIVYFNRAADLAVVQTKTKPVRALKMAKQPPDYGDQVAIVGHPMGTKTPILFQGHVAAPNMEEGFMILDMESCAGHSGSAVTNKKDEIVSVVQINFMGHGTHCSGTTGAAPWPVMVRLVGGYFG